MTMEKIIFYRKKKLNFSHIIISSSFTLYRSCHDRSRWFSKHKYNLILFSIYHKYCSFQFSVKFKFNPDKKLLIIFHFKKKKKEITNKKENYVKLKLEFRKKRENPQYCEEKYFLWKIVWNLKRIYIYIYIIGYIYFFFEKEEEIHGRFRFSDLSLGSATLLNSFV